MKNQKWSLLSTTKVLLLLSALFLSLLGLIKSNSRVTGSSWPAVEGIVTETKIEAEVPGLLLAPTIHYRYITDGKAYSGQHLINNERPFDPAVSRLMVDSFPKGKVVFIRFNPASPDQSVIDMSSQTSSLGLYITAVVFFILAYFPWRWVSDVFIPSRSPH